jgi:hypothetical protein
MMSDAGGQIDTMLRHLGSGHDFQNFPGTTAEKLGLMRTANARGLIAWSKARGRYELTRIGWRQVAPRQGVGLASLVVCTSIGAMIGAGALAALWLPDDASHRPAGRQPPAPVSRLVDPGGGLRTSPQTASASFVAPKAKIDPVPTAQPDTPMEPARVAEQPVPEQPIAAAPTSTKQAAVKKSRHKTVRARTYRTWAWANSYRDERYAGRMFR